MFDRSKNQQISYSTKCRTKFSSSLGTGYFANSSVRRFLNTLLTGVSDVFTT